MLYIVLLLVLIALGLVVAALVTASSVWAWVSIGASGLAGVLLLVDRVRRSMSGPTRESEPSRADADNGTANDDGSETDETGETGTTDATDASTSAEPDGRDLEVAEGASVSGAREAVGSAEAGEVVDETTPTEVTDPVDTVTADADRSDVVADTERSNDGSGATAVSGAEPTAEGSSDTAGDARGGSAEATLVAAPVDAEPDEEPVVSAREPVSAGGIDPLTDTAPRTALLASSGELAGADVDPPEEDSSVDDALLVSDLLAEVLVVDEFPRYHLGHCGWLGTRATIPLAVREARELGFTPCGLCGPDAALAAAHRRRRVARRNTA